MGAIDLFDGHCDTVFQCLHGGGGFARNHCHLDLERAGTYRRYAQFFALYGQPEDFAGTALEGITHQEIFRRGAALFQREMEAIVRICREENIISKVIFENCYLTEEEIKKTAQIARRVKPDYIKTSTGFGTGGAVPEDVALMKSIVGDDVKVKAAGGIRDLETALAMIDAGAERLGTSAAGEK